MASSRHKAPGITTSVSVREALPAGRAFVVQLRADADLARGVVRGRVEHVVSGIAALFDSVDQLVSSMRDAENTIGFVRSRPAPSSSCMPDGPRERRHRRDRRRHTDG